jgi:flavin-dependent dehydrogenase
MASAQQTYDIVVYGGTAAGVISAVSAARQGMRVALLEPGEHLGGMASGGLSATDFGHKEVIGGYALEFYERIGKRYNVDRYGINAAWYYEPHVGERVFDDMVKEAGVAIFFDHRLREKDGVTKTGVRITEIRTENGARFRARIYIDSSYEGDLMAQAGVSYTWGRESSSQYDESLAGVRMQTPYHQWHVKGLPIRPRRQATAGSVAGCSRCTGNIRPEGSGIQLPPVSNAGPGRQDFVSEAGSL